MKRNRLVQLLLVALTVAVGLASRQLRGSLPPPAVDAIGDIFWAMNVFWLAGLLFPARPTIWITFLSLAFALAVELTQLYHSPWLDSLRATFLGGLILGYNFVWTDLVCYALGIAWGAVIDKAFLFMKK